MFIERKKQFFIEKRVSSTAKFNPGSGTFTVDIPFVPDYIKVKFLDPAGKRELDNITWDLNFTGIPSMPYQLIVNWEVLSAKPRRLRYIVAKLASFHNGVNK